MPLHRDSTLENIHRHHRWEVNNQAGLDALVPDALDIHKVAYKKDDDTYHVLKSVSPTVWVQTAYTKAKVDELLELKQDTLVSGTNIKTINGESVLGSGNLVISGGGAVDLSDYYKKTETYSKVEVDTKIADIPTTDLSGYYNKTETYSKVENDNLLAKKANLDLNNKIPLSEIPDSILGQLKYMGVWDFSSGFPTGAQKGNYWITSVSGNGYEVGDWAVYNGTSFDKVDNTDAVSSVAGRTGNVVLNKNDVGLNNVDNTSDLNKPISTATQTALDTTVKLTGNQTIAGIKTFTSSIVGNISGNSATATKLATARTINGVSFDGSANITVSDDTKLTKTNPAITGSVTEQVYNLTGTVINPANGTIQYKTVSANTTFTETLISGQSVLLRLINATSYTITFPTITWVGADAPILTANCAIALWKEQSTLYGAYIGTLVW